MISIYGMRYLNRELSKGYRCQLLLARLSRNHQNEPIPECNFARMAKTSSIVNSKIFYLNVEQTKMKTRLPRIDLNRLKPVENGMQDFQI